jgi:ankyrin repeat protein
VIENGADIEKVGPEGYRPLSLAIAEDKFEAAKVLMDAGANVNMTAGSDELTPLMVAASQISPAEGAIFLPSSTRPINIAEGLIERGANVNAKSKSGLTALMIAAANNNPPMIGLLIDAGADVDTKNNQGKTAADVANSNGNAEAAQAIMVLGTAKSASGAPPKPADGQRSTSQ